MDNKQFQTAPAAAHGTGQWLLAGKQPVTVSPTAVQLFCVPQAGMGAWVYQAWAQRLAPNIQVQVNCILLEVLCSVQRVPNAVLLLPDFHLCISDSILHPTQPCSPPLPPHPPQLTPPPFHTHPLHPASLCCQVMPIELPGHGSRMKEPRVTNLCEISCQAVDAIQPHIR